MTANGTANDSINGNKSRDSGQARLNELYSLISHHADLYYNQDRPEIEDSEYDVLVRELKQLEATFPDLARKDFLTHQRQHRTYFAAKRTWL